MKKQDQKQEQLEIIIEKPQLCISVRNLVEFVMRSGDIDDRHGSADKMSAMQEGSRIHRKIQRRMGGDYHAEVPLKYVITYEDYDLGIEGRADGIIYEDDEAIDDVTIDEIKGMYQDVKAMTEPMDVHLAQAKCYAYIFATQHDLNHIGVQMTYCNLDTEEIQYFREHYLYEDLEDWFLKLMQQYKRWSDFQYYWRNIRQASIGQLEFPYEYRNGQHQLISDVYRSINRKKILFIQAPTGSGKTIATIFPAVKAVGENLGDKIFYLTAKTITQSVARETFSLFEKHGYRGKTISVTAKDKMCLCEERQCNPDYCIYAKGHFDRINDAVYDLLQEQDHYDRDTLLDWAREKKVCPFELCLDTATWADNIICDYNYVFDPNVYLKRFFADGIRGDYIFLIDEAHNLVDRAREMYSATLIKEDFLYAKKVLGRFDKRFIRQLDRCNRIMLDWKRDCEKYLILEQVDELIYALMGLGAVFDDFLEKDYAYEEQEEILKFYFSIRDFLNLSEGLDERYRIYCDYDDRGQFQVHLFCVDPSLLLQSRLDRGNATVFFSATLIPIQYYKQLLSTRDDNYAIYADTEFDPAHRKLFIAKGVSSKYTRRSLEEYRKYAEYIYTIVKEKQGNYMVFFPSYKFMEDVYQQFLSFTLGTVDVIVQSNNMKESEREEFLQEFEEERSQSMVAFCVLGGIFSEGIDLTKERLIGAIIVGTGLPQVGNERDILQKYFDEKAHMGFEYAYLYPGMNKVMQAAGRVIRTAEDVGVIALLDERFTQREYLNTFPREWKEYQVCNMEETSKMLMDFWKHV